MENSHASIQKNVIKIAWPVFVELLLSSLFSMVNMMMIGRIADVSYATSATAAIGLTAQPLNLAISLVQAMNVGGTALISRYFGAKKTDKIGHVLKHVMILSVCCFIIPVCLLVFFFARPLIVFLGAQPDTVMIAVAYLRLMMVSFLFQGFTMTISAALRGVGETKIPMRNNLIANFMNVVLNCVFIYVLGLGLVGTGVSTILANGIACVLMTRYLISGKGAIRFSFKEPFRFDVHTVKQLARISLPSTLEQLIFRMGAIIFTMIVSGLGTAVYAAHQIGLNLWILSISPGQSFGIAASALVGQSLGARNRDKAKRYVKSISYMALSVAVIMGVMFYVLDDVLASGYSSSTEVIHNLLIIMPILSMIQPLLAHTLVMTGALRGSGDTLWPMISTIFGVLIVRTGLAHVLVDDAQLGLIGAWIALIASQFVTWLIIVIRFKTGKWVHVAIE